MYVDFNTYDMPTISNKSNAYDMPTLEMCYIKDRFSQGQKKNQYETILLQL